MTSIATPSGAPIGDWIEMLERLSHVEARGNQVLSLYLDLDPTRFPTPDTRETQLGALIDEARRLGSATDADRVAAWLAANPEITRGAHGLAIFACTAAEILEVVPLPDAVEPLAVVDEMPWLEPLAAMVSPGDWGVAVVSRRAARLFRGGGHGLVEFAHIDDELYRRHAQGGWSQARFQRGIEEQVAVHVRRTAERLLRAHQRRPFAHLVIVASHELEPVIEHSLPGALAEVHAATVSADLEHASVDEIAQAIAPVIEQDERYRERALVERIDQALGTGGPAAAGLDEVLAMLEQRRVETLLVPERSTARAGVCPTCGRLSTADDGRCPLDNAALAEVDALEHAVGEAAGQSATVVVVRHEQDWLRDHGDFAATLHW